MYPLITREEYEELKAQLDEEHKVAKRVLFLTKINLGMQVTLLSILLLQLWLSLQRLR